MCMVIQDIFIHKKKCLLQSDKWATHFQHLWKFLAPYKTVWQNSRKQLSTSPQHHSACLQFFLSSRQSFPISVMFATIMPSHLILTSNCLQDETGSSYPQIDCGAREKYFTCNHHKGYEIIASTPFCIKQEQIARPLVVDTTEVLTNPYNDSRNCSFVSVEHNICNILFCFNDVNNNLIICSKILSAQLTFCYIWAYFSTKESS